MLASMRRDCCMRSPHTTSHRFQSTAHQLNTHVVRVALTRMKSCCSSLLSHSPNVSFILISSSPDIDVLNQQRVVVLTDFIRMLSGNMIGIVFKSDAVISWQRSSALPDRCSTKCCICQKSQDSAMSPARGVMIFVRQSATC